MKISLKTPYSFGIAPNHDKLRLIVYDQNGELVCRKERRKKLTEFLSEDTGHTFKGRLQLIKRKNTIAIQVKGETIGSLKKSEFESLIKILE